MAERRLERHPQLSELRRRRLAVGERLPPPTGGAVDEGTRPQQQSLARARPDPACQDESGLARRLGSGVAQAGQRFGLAAQQPKLVTDCPYRAYPLEHRLNQGQRLARPIQEYQGIGGVPGDAATSNSRSCCSDSRAQCFDASPAGLLPAAVQPLFPVRCKLGHPGEAERLDIGQDASPFVPTPEVEQADADIPKRQHLIGEQATPLGDLQACAVLFDGHLQPSPIERRHPEGGVRVVAECERRRRRSSGASPEH